jgi:hypothetical protein
MTDGPGGQGPLTTRSALRTPRAAAVAGIAFSALLISSLALLRVSVPANPAIPGAWLTDSGKRAAVAIGLNLIPFAGIAFLWFIGVLRDRIGAHEDRFFATVFLGSGLLFVGMLFVAAAVAGGLIADMSFSAPPGADTLVLGRNVTSLLLNVYSMRMAAVFTLTTVTIARRTKIVSPAGLPLPGLRPRWCCWSASASQPGRNCCSRPGFWQLASISSQPARGPLPAPRKRPLRVDRHHWPPIQPPLGFRGTQPGRPCDSKNDRHAYFRARSGACRATDHSRGMHPQAPADQHLPADASHPLYFAQHSKTHLRSNAGVTQALGGGQVSVQVAAELRRGADGRGLRTPPGHLW